MNKSSFLKQCKKNREILDFSYQDISNVLIGVSATEYKNFEDGKILVSRENLERIARVLGIEEFNKFNLDDYIDTDGLSEEEIVDLKDIVEKLVGEVDA